MKIKLNKKIKRLRRHKRIRAKIKGTPERPRLSVYVSNIHVYAQIIDDENGVTLVSASSLEFKNEKLSGMEKARKVGELIAERALEKGIKKVVFDRGGFKYTGRIKIVAESARGKGLEF